MVSLREIDQQVNSVVKKPKRNTKPRRMCPACGEPVVAIETATEIECPECGHVDSKVVKIDVPKESPRVATPSPPIAKAEPEYTDQEREFADLESGGKFVSEEGQIRQILRDFAGDKGISGQTDMSPDMVVLFTQIRILEDAFPGLGLEIFPQWFEVYRLNVGRASRREQVEMTRGQVSIGEPRESGPAPPNRGW